MIGGICRDCGAVIPYREGPGPQASRCATCVAIPNAALVWRGRSMLAPSGNVSVVVTGLQRGSLNPKIGAMAQVWIVPDVEPRIAFKRGDDVASCGDCPQRWSQGGGCYVHWRWGPQQVWFTVQAGGYVDLDTTWLRGRRVRFGAYGDPCAVPLEVWRPMLAQLDRWTGYTHQWRRRDPRAWGWLMASVDSVEQQADARARGWRTFRVRAAGDGLLDREIVCPAADEATVAREVTCASCGLCNGGGVAGERARVRDIAIVAHGQRARMAVDA